MSITVLLYSWTIHERYICSNLWSHVQNTNAFSYALLWRVVYSSQFNLLFDVALFWRTFHIDTGKADAKDFAVLVLTGNAHFQWIWSDNFWSRDSSPPIAVGEKHRLYNNIAWAKLFVSFVSIFLIFNEKITHLPEEWHATWTRLFRLVFVVFHAQLGIPARGN